MTFTTILVPLDGTASAATALPLARTLATVSQASLLLIRVVPDEDSSGEAEQYLRGVAEELRDQKVRWVVRQGTPVEELVAEGCAASADLVVMATHGRAGVQRALLGSVAEQMIARSPAPIALVRPGGKRVSQLKTLLVPTDGTAGAGLALSTAVGLARASGARLALVEAVEPFPLWLYDSNTSGVDLVHADPAWDAQTLQTARMEIDSLVARLRKAGLDARGLASMGGVVPTIEATADQIDADLIVMSTHAYTGATRALLGSTADELVRTAKRPVLLVRRPARALDFAAAEPAASTAV